jgi:ATPase subunit of ABC transporter with duplicated ATPase domains
MGSIQVSHVGWRRPGGAEQLRDVSFGVGNGDRVALVGANGVGKSTLLRALFPRPSHLAAELTRR